MTNDKFICDNCLKTLCVDELVGEVDNGVGMCNLCNDNLAREEEADFRQFRHEITGNMNNGF